jgi:hypothetical protein
MLSRVMNLLFQESDKPWGVEPSPVPNLDGKDLQAILTAVDTKAQQEGRQITDDEIEIAIRAFAAKRAERLETEIEDQLRELGGDRALDFVALCRKVILSGIMYGLGILKGPFITDQKQRTWARDPATGQLMAKNIVAERPRYEFIPIWDYYPDLSAKTFKQMDGQFTRVVMSRHQVTQLKERKDFFNDQIDACSTRSRTATTSAARSRRSACDGSGGERDAIGARQVRGDRVGRRGERQGSARGRRPRFRTRSCRWT